MNGFKNKTLPMLAHAQSCGLKKATSLGKLQVLLAGSNNQLEAAAYRAEVQHRGSDTASS